MERYRKQQSTWQRNRTFVFLIFLSLSLLIWCIITLSATYRASVPFTLIYDNLPADKILVGTPPAQLRVQVESSGFRILGTRIAPKKLYLNTAFSRKASKGGFFLREDIREIVMRQYPQFRIERIERDTLFFAMGTMDRQDVRVTPSLDIKFRNDYELIDSLALTPTVVTLTGPTEILDTMTVIETETLSLSDLHEDFEVELALNVPESLGVHRVVPDKVKVRGIVGRYTEKVFEVPVTVINVPEDTQVRLFPSAARIRCKATLEDMKRLDATGFEIIADISRTNPGSPYVLLEVVRVPAFVKDYMLLDQKVEYLVRSL